MVVPFLSRYFFIVRAGLLYYGILYLYVNKRKDVAMGTNFAVAPGEYLQEWIDGNGSVLFSLLARTCS